MRGLVFTRLAQALIDPPKDRSRSFYVDMLLCSSGVGSAVGKTYGICLKDFFEHLVATECGRCSIRAASPAASPRSARAPSMTPSTAPRSINYVACMIYYKDR